MRNYLAFIILLLSGPIVKAQMDRPIGVNLSSLSPFSSQIVFKDGMKQSRDWLAQHADMSDFDVTDIGGTPVIIPLDDQGWPRYAPFIVAGDTLIPHITLLNNQPAPWYYPSGNYSVIFEGTGQISVHGDDVAGGVSLLSVPDSVHSVSITGSNEGIYLAILSSDSLDPIRNIRFVLPGHYPSFETDPFMPEFKDILEPFTVLRFMKPQAIEENTIENWEDRTHLDYYHYWGENEGNIRTGLPYELLIRLCNETEKDPWINIPFKVNNDYIDSLAFMLRDSLDTSRTIYLEYGNETWNPDYPVTHDYVDSMGVAMGFGVDTFSAGLEYHCYRSFEVFERFDSIFGAGDHRLYKLIATQAYDVPGRIIVDAILDPTINPSGMLPDALCEAPYIGAEVVTHLMDDAMSCSVDEQDLLDSLETGIPGWMEEMCGSFSFWADSLGIELISYEGGQYLSYAFGLAPADSCSEVNLIAANRDPRMEDVYCQYYDYWYDSLSADLHMAFTLCESYGPYGATGIVESVFQDTSTSYKMRAHRNCTGIGLITERVVSLESPAPTVFPNPFKRSIRMRGLESPSEYEVIDLNGKRIRSGLIQVDELLDLGALPSSIYLLKVWSGEGWHCFKIIKQ